MNLCWCSSPYSLNCHVGAMLVFCMLYRITQSSDAHRTESASVMDHEQTMEVNSRVLNQKQQNKQLLCRYLAKHCTDTEILFNNFNEASSVSDNSA